MLKDLIGESSTVMSGLGLEDVLVRHAIPYVMGVVDVKEIEKKNGAKPFIMYASMSRNSGFQRNGKQIKFDEVNYASMDDLFLETKAIENNTYGGAFSYLLNIQKICNRCISDCATMMRKKQISLEQYKYMEDHLNMIIYASYTTLEEQKKILIHEGASVTNYVTKTDGMSKYCQMFRMAQALRLLIEVGAIARGY